ncbi:hypothetical protein [Niabella drilacis]|uniref:YXWGXW repeat-containing protein n=1 Tax=Niabella drilacis (strain DSM 25811 / CCM 8410 / CCUG 62505 / LMG 26954 / E90) TaxID=1285928 RepID=A0A1G6WRP7_NIADE|nr:hypothetical protein [Niabella drilacis]SDD68454.1 hypothetical protein SAMN04487894_1125 [Niabella drilacis]
MKKLFILMMLAGGMAATQPISAQVHISVNIGNQPQWGPYGYNYNQARYYYLPEINVYYDVYNKTYIYQDRRSWVTTRSLPRQYGNVNLYNTYKVVINNRNPWRDNAVHQNRYSRYRNDHTQVSIRDYAYRNNNNRKDKNSYRNDPHNRDYAHDRDNRRRY